MKISDPLPNSAAGLASKMQQTPDFLAFRKAFLAGQWSVDFASINKEIDAQHLRNKLRMIKASQLTKSVLDEANLQNAAHRSRLVEICINLQRINSSLFQRIIRVQEDLRATFAKELKTHYRTKGERESAVENLFKRPNDQLAALELAISTVELMLKDLDASAWTIDRHVKLHIASLKGMDMG